MSLREKMDVVNGGRKIEDYEKFQDFQFRSRTEHVIDCEKVYKMGKLVVGMMMMMVEAEWKRKKRFKKFIRLNL